MKGLQNGTLWVDSAGHPIQAHGGWILSIAFLPIKHDPIEIAWADRFPGLRH